MASLEPPHGVIPATPEELTATWLSTVLTRYGFSAAVEGIAFRPPATASMTSEILHVIPRVQDETTGVAPALIWKRSSAEPRRREAFRRAYEAEVHFYREVAPRARVSAPRCFVAAYEPASGEHVLLLEDMTGPPRDPVGLDEGQIDADGVAPDLTVDDAGAILNELARLHASTWLAEGPDARRGVRGGATSQAAGESRGTEDSRFVDALVAGADARTRSYAAKESTLAGRLGAGPLAVVHGDIRPGNVIISPSSGGRLSLVDWQHSRVASPLLDVAKLLTFGFETEVRRRAERDLVHEYVRELRTLGAPLGTEAAMSAYRMALVMQWGQVLELGRHGELWDPATESAMPKLATRAAAAFDDVETTETRA